MNNFTQHIPTFARDPDWTGEPSFEFEGTHDLLGLPVVAKYRTGDPSEHFAINETRLMLVSNHGFGWWVVGFINNPTTVQLPVWSGGRHLAELPNGSVRELEKGEFQWSRGNEIGLIDGSKLVNPLYSLTEGARVEYVNALIASGVIAPAPAAPLPDTPDKPSAQ